MENKEETKDRSDGSSDESTDAVVDFYCNRCGSLMPSRCKICDDYMCVVCTRYATCRCCEKQLCSNCRILCNTLGTNGKPIRNLIFCKFCNEKCSHITSDTPQGFKVTHQCKRKSDARKMAKEESKKKEEMIKDLEDAEASFKMKITPISFEGLRKLQEERREIPKDDSFCTIV